MKPRISLSGELELKTTLRELVVYVVFLTDLCLCKSPGGCSQITCTLHRSGYLLTAPVYHPNVSHRL